MVTTDRPPMLTRQAAIWAAVRGDFAAIGLITAAVLVSMRDTVIFGKVANADALALWLPVWTYLGRALRAGHIPLWQSNLMGGAPFASDAQSGWGYIEPSLLFVLLSPDHAIRTMLVLQPLTAGIGLYFLLRVERLPRWAACCGGLALSMAMTGSTLVDALPFSASLAWTVLTLLACSRLLVARTWARRLVWMVPTAIAWGQIAAAHAGSGPADGKHQHHRLRRHQADHRRPQRSAGAGPGDCDRSHRWQCRRPQSISPISRRGWRTSTRPAWGWGTGR